jgi:hypothetical protein
VRLGSNAWAPGGRTVDAEYDRGVIPPVPDLVLYERPGCHLCDEARDAIQTTLEDRAARGLANPRLVERNIEEDEELHRLYLERIPVVELGDRRLELIVTASKVRRLLAEVLDSTMTV